VRFNRLLRNLAAFVAVSVVGLAAGSDGWSADGSLKLVLQSRYAAMKAAMAAHNGLAIAAILAPDFVSIGVMGQSETASQMIAEVNGLMPDPNKSSETTLMSVIPAANAVTVEQRYDMKTIRTATDGTQHNVELITISTDTWIKPAGAWLIERTVTNEMSLFRDGQLVGHKKKS
jgi:hypothetical protein